MEGLDPRELARATALAESALDAKVRSVEPLQPGLGTRRFARLQLDRPPHRLIARIERPEDPAGRPAGVLPEPPLEPVRALLERSGVRVARRWAADADAGIELHEDLGDRSLELAVREATAAQRRDLYAEACDFVPRLQALSAPADDVPNFGRRLDTALFAYKAEQVVEHALTWALGREARAPEARVVREAFAWIAEQAAAAPARLAHRDFKAQNLHLLQAAPRGARLALIDIQGAFLAPPEYDLVCLLRDAHVPLSDAEVAAHAEAVRPRLPDAPTPEAFRQRFALLTVTRVGKDLARFLYAARARDDARYLRLVPEAARCVRAAATEASGWHPALAHFAELFHESPVDAERGAACER